MEADSLTFLDYAIENLYLQMPENILKTGAFSFHNIHARNIEGSFDETLAGQADFTMHGGKGTLSYETRAIVSDYSLNFSFNIKDLDIESLVSSLSEEVHISGIMDISGSGRITEDSHNIEIAFNSKRVRGVPQFMNFGAVKVISSVGGSGPAETIGRANFNYSLIAGKLTLQDGYLTIEGRAGERNGQEFLVRGGLFGGINLFIDKTANTIKLEYLRRRIQAALQSGF